MKFVKVQTLIIKAFSFIKHTKQNDEHKTVAQL